MENKKPVICCPQCRRKVGPDDYMNARVLGAISYQLPRIRCPCGYLGMPIQLEANEYEEWLKEGTENRTGENRGE